MIPNSVTEIAPATFSGCSSLTNITIGDSATSIGACAFWSCGNLSAVHFLGNAPVLKYPPPPATSEGPFYDIPATAYYLPGTTGWGTSFGGLPTELWNPLIAASGVNFGIQSNQFGFTISWAPDLPVVVEACTDLGNPVWQPLQSIVLTNGVFNFSDLQWTDYPARFYRVTAQ